MKAKKIISIVACTVMVMSLAACGKKDGDFDVNPGEATESISIGGGVQIPNPWVQCADVTEAEKNAGFTFEIPGSIEGYKLAYVQNLGTELIEVKFEATDESGKSLNVRKGTGTDDVSGDYNAYAESKQVTVGAYDVTIKGNNGTVSLATWTDGEFSYALSTPEMSEEAVAALIGGIK